MEYTHNLIGGFTVEKMQFLYQLKLIPSLLEESNWSDKENNIVQHHFEELQPLQKTGRLI